MSPETVTRGSETQGDPVREMLLAGKDSEKSIRAIVDEVRSGTVGHSGIDDLTVISGRQ